VGGVTTTKHPRLAFGEHAPEVLKAMFALEKASKKGVDPVIAELIKIRASQINHCAFCLDMHVKEARKAGETDDRMHLVAAWEEAEGHFSEKECAAPALTEAVTRLPDGVPDEVYERAARHFDEAELAHLIAMIFTINSWNRINVTLRTPVGYERPGR
jgi:AhpD family alkylhydroperoxidase